MDWKILEAMRAIEAFREVPVAVLSSSSSPREPVERYRIGRFIAKPPDLDEYMKIGVAMRQLLEEHGSRRRFSDTE